MFWTSRECTVMDGCWGNIEVHLLDVTKHYSAEEQAESGMIRGNKRVSNVAKLSFILFMLSNFQDADVSKILQRQR